MAVFALACGAPNAPRRVFFVVDRRIVVDQAFRHADALAKVLDRATDGILRDVADRLREIAEPGWLSLGAEQRDRVLIKGWEIRDEPDPKKRGKLIDSLGPDEKNWFDIRPLDVYALRGGMYRESAWARSPLQPTVIASTVDQVGSRLLFRGYGVSDGMKPVHAALVGNDALILLDEAHCAKPFEQTVRAVQNYQAWHDAVAPLRFVSMTATPTTDGDVMRDDEADRAHAVLGKRIDAKKPATLVIADKAKGKAGVNDLVKTLELHARALAVEGGCVGVIVNRVKTARLLAAKLGSDAVLLTGRMRPLDRDKLFEAKLKPLLSNADGTPPKFVVGTQCLEVGADFDFAALVTECASLDALRQRFGRLNRVARRDTVKAVVVVRGDETDDTSEDPVYGASLGNTWKWLTAEGTRAEFDFGVAAVRAELDKVNEKQLAAMNAPTADAPVLFPAHLDCWVQTHPVPTPDPDPAVFLHGPTQPGQPDVQVVFRNDLGANRDAWAAVVGLCPPSSSEAVAVPIGLFKKWLAGVKLDDPTSDLEGGPPEEAEDLEPQGRYALCWKGDDADETAVVTDPDDVRPNRTYVVECGADDVKFLGDFVIDEVTDAPADYAEEAFQRSRDKAILRLPDFKFSKDTDEEYEDKLTDAIEARLTDGSPDWVERAVKGLRTRAGRVADDHPGGGVVVTGRRRLFQFDPEVLDDGASSYVSGRAVTLDDHSRGVAEHAVKFATGCKLAAELYRTAGLLHDLGKLDPRFQAMLKQSSPRTAVGVPLAKSARGPRNKFERDEARLVHQYPTGARHEHLSSAIVAAHTSGDDLLHLIDTHHGSARPFADAVEDEGVPLPFDVKHFGLDLPYPSARQDIAAWNAELPERFWRQVRKYGWWGSAYREAVFRLADHAQSRAEQDRDGPPPPTAALNVTLPARIARAASFALPLPGLDGANPLAFLAALGTLRLANRAFPGARLSWSTQGACSAILHLPHVVTPDALVEALLAQAGAGRRSVTFAPDIKVLAADFRAFEAEAVGVAQEDREFADFLRAFADPLVTVQGGPNIGKTKPTEFYFLAGNQKLLKQLMAIAQATTEAHLHKALFQPWVYDDPLDGLSLRWDPLDDFRYATRFFNPSKDNSKAKRGSVLGANRLAFESLPFFPCYALKGRLATTGFTVIDRQPFFTWPLWSAPWGIDEVRSVVSRVEPPKRAAKLQRVVPPRQLGVTAWYQCEKVANSDYSNFSPARRIA